MIRPTKSIKGKVHAAVIKEYPELENIEITPTLEDQIFKSTKYGFDEIKVKGVQSYIDEDIRPEYIKEGVNILGIDGTYTTEKPLTVSIEEPIGENRTKFWIQKSKNMCDMSFFETGVTTGGGITSSVTNLDVTIKTQWRNPWCAMNFRIIELTGLEGQYITVSFEIKVTNSEDGGSGLGTCDINFENRKTITPFRLITKNDGRVSLTMQVPETITDTNRYMFMSLNATGSYTPTFNNAYTTYTNIQIEVGDTATEYETNYIQRLFILNTDDEYVTFDENTKF